MSISRSNMIFQQMKLGTSVIPHFHVILTGQFISKIIWLFKLIFKVKMQFQGQVSKNIILTSNARNMGNTSFFVGFWPENPFIVLCWGFKVVRSIPRSKCKKTFLLRKKNRKKCNTSFSFDVDLFFVSFWLYKLFPVLFWWLKVIFKVKRWISRSSEGKCDFN